MDNHAESTVFASLSTDSETSNWQAQENTFADEQEQGTWSLATAEWTPSDEGPLELDEESAPSNVALGTLTRRVPGREFSYRFIPDDLVWTAKLLVHEAGGRDDPDNAGPYCGPCSTGMRCSPTKSTRRSPPSCERTRPRCSRSCSTRAAARHVHRPPTEFVRHGGTYKGTTIPRGQLKRHLDIQRAPWQSVKASARALAAVRALAGGVPNPGIGLASEFASTRIYFKQRHGRDPNIEEWRQYTTDLASKKRWRWIGDIPGLDQMKNAFFVDLRAAGLPVDAVGVLAPRSAGEVWEFDEDERGEWELDEREPDAEIFGQESEFEETEGEAFEAEEFARHADFEELSDSESSFVGEALSSPPKSRPAVLTTATMRQAWLEDLCLKDRMVEVRILGWTTPVNARTVNAWAALDQALVRTSYMPERAWVYNCRNVAGTVSRSMHAFGLAIDIDPKWNPNCRTPDKRPVRFSDAATQAERITDVRRRTADTV